jgi:hypothetical protein
LTLTVTNRPPGPIYRDTEEFQRRYCAVCCSAKWIPKQSKGMWLGTASIQAKSLYPNGLVFTVHSGFKNVDISSSYPMQMMEKNHRRGPNRELRLLPAPLLFSNGGMSFPFWALQKQSKRRGHSAKKFNFQPNNGYQSLPNGGYLTFELEISI